MGMISKSSTLQTSLPKHAFPGEIRVFFGHQSVGKNILDGIRNDHPNAKIVAYTQQEIDDQQYGIFHKTIGHNGDPHSKIDEFVHCLQGSPASFDIALMKLCYADIGARTNVNELFEHYQSAMNSLSGIMSGTRILHCTVPLRSIRLGVRSYVRRVFGHPIAAIQDNSCRDAFNSLLRDAYSQSCQILDIAAIESTSPDGSICGSRYRGVRVPALDPHYTDDGGHLNSEGQHRVASEFVQLINETRL